MTATVDAGSQQAVAAPPVPPTPGQPHLEDAERQRQLLQALTTEHFTLQTARSATIADSNGRSALYLSTVSGAVVALAFIGQVTHLRQAFFLFALALLPALVLLGTLTYLRLVQTAIEDLFYARAINRIRRHYVDLDPDGARWFLLCGFDDPAGFLAAMGLAAPGAAHSRWHLLSHAATMVAVVTSIIGGVFVALAANVAASRWPPARPWALWSPRPGPRSSGGTRCAAGGPLRTASPACSPPSQPPSPARPTADPDHPLASSPPHPGTGAPSTWRDLRFMRSPCRAGRAGG